MPKKNRKRACEVVIASDPTETRRVREDIENALKRHRFDERDIFCVQLALEEALVNAMKHGNQMDPDKKIHICYHIQDDRCEIRIEDEGAGFDPGELPDPKAAENLERPTGRGILLIRHFMNEVTFHPPGNQISMCKFRNGHE
jgi:serine/threonine-protein kinase RsbW